MRVNENVFGLEISKQDVSLMNVRDAEDELRSDELGELLVKKLVSVELLSQVSVLAKLHDHVQVFGCLEGVHQAEHVRVVKLSHDLGLLNCVLDLVVRDQYRLLHRLHGIQLLVVSLLHLVDLSKRTFAQKFQHLEVFELHGASRSKDDLRRVLLDVCLEGGVWGSSVASLATLLSVSDYSASDRNWNLLLLLLNKFKHLFRFLHLTRRLLLWFRNSLLL